MPSSFRYFSRYHSHNGLWNNKRESIVGWLVVLKTDKYVLEQDIDEIVQNLPIGLKGAFRGAKQQWGWSAGADIIIKEQNLHLSGSYGISGGIAESITQHFKEALEKKSYKVEREDHW